MNMRTEKWKLCKGIVDPDVEDEIAREILKKFSQEVLESFYFSDPRLTKDGERTRKLFEVLTLLGDKMGYKVYSHSLSPEFREEHKEEDGRPKFVNREWLYDLIWYTEDNARGYSPKDFPLLVESEWRNKRSGDKTGDKRSGIKYDFQKLLLSNTGLRLMIFRIAKESYLDDLTLYFQEAIDGYRPLEEGRFLFVAFCHTKKAFYYWYKRK